MKRPGQHPLREPSSASPATTRTAQGQQQQPVPRLPHERDESADSQAPGEPWSEHVGRIAQSDAQRGLPDTTRGAETDAAYHQLRAQPPATPASLPGSPDLRNEGPCASRR